jgi:hypothetical protein
MAPNIYYTAFNSAVLKITSGYPQTEQSMEIAPLPSRHKLTVQFSMVSGCSALNGRGRPVVI